ncbi:hypothetical protein C7M61_003010 [Candidozyma pseudohaemuli]|uniref:Asparagine-rich protein n=1 Tax=Candidozyma pseudohaemuli TaxID=418784 RepID=A0A2P7YP68_9ASCO|nr:hypothetical protein C7M61_003010 [[Candida] pseudohaemulonii]PSK37766.1 hypothetical protein C7M61_003010 [[Candida] pseudohaemulonii]
MADIYVVVHLETTWDVALLTPQTHSPAELRSLLWCVVDADLLEQLKPECLHVGDNDKNALTFKDAIGAFDKSVSEAVAQKDFSFITTDIHNLRVSLPREARDRQVVLPVYLQHPRVFDLFNEYSKWQLTHPEALSYPSSYLSNLVTALSVDVPEDWASDESDVPLVDIHARVLAQLARKSLPVEEHPTVLTKPYDTAHDAKVFLAERSKILYLSNLPSDTTQSELESWFTQFGGRPIAFWTLKNADGESKSQNKSKGICGFAVFAKHEEAAQSLFMNGRVLNDRVVEVQASSTRVLDKAADLLTPFPLSKNRPRPGDWTCPSCGFSNFQRRIACFRCLFPATSAVAIQEQMFLGALDSSNGNSQQRRLKHDDKVAPQAYGNYTDYYSGSQMKSGGYNYNFNHGHMGMNNNGVPGGSGGNNGGHRMHYGNSVPFRAGDWKCTNENCQYHNFAKNLCCLKCGRAKPASVNSGHNHHNNHHAGHNNNHGHANNHSHGHHHGHHNNNNNNHGNQGGHNNHNAAAAAAAAAAAGSIHSVNTTAAAIAAATASGQPLNLSNNFLGLQQPQAHLTRHGQGLHGSQSSSSSPIQNGGLYSNISQLQQLQFPQKLGQQNLQSQDHLGQGAAHLPQHLAFLQSQSASPQMQGQQRQKSSLSGSSPGLQGSGYPYKGQQHPEEGLLNNSGINLLGNQIKSLSLNDQ